MRRELGVTTWENIEFALGLVLLGIVLVVAALLAWTSVTIGPVS